MNQKSILDRYKTGENIRNNIIESGYTYDQVAEILELTTARVIYDWVNGIKMPSLENLIKLTLLFNIQLEDILEIQNVF